MTEYLLEISWEELDPLLAAFDVIVGGWTDRDSKVQLSKEDRKLLRRIAIRLGGAKSDIVGHLRDSRAASNDERQAQADADLAGWEDWRQLHDMGFHVIDLSWPEERWEVLWEVLNSRRTVTLTRAEFHSLDGLLYLARALIDNSLWGPDKSPMGSEFTWMWTVLTYRYISPTLRSVHSRVRKLLQQTELEGGK